jgi:macrodomain Ter protein organizer (MatP/YcbG family)
MSTYKRRIIYISDEEWTGLAALAQKRKLTISATIRELLTDRMETIRQTLPNSQAQRDELLRKINRTK